MNRPEYSSRPRLFVAISSLVLLTLLLAVCGGPTTSRGAVTPTPSSSAISSTVQISATQTSCPRAGKARAGLMSGGIPMTAASGVNASPVGWTTM